MDPIEILGSLLGQKAGGSGAGAEILKEIFGGASRQEREAPASQTQGGQQPWSQSQAAPRSRGPARDDVELEARELEDLLNVAKDRGSRPPTVPARPASQASPPAQPAPPRAAERPVSSGVRNQPAPVNRTDMADDQEARQGEQALTLIRAMVNAAKCDGEISQAEQQRILGQLENPSPAAIQFLREEFAKPLDVRAFAWSVPVGMEQQVYTMSLIAMDVDTEDEEGYLRDLAHGLRLTPEVCQQIQARLTSGPARYAGAR